MPEELSSKISHGWNQFLLSRSETPIGWLPGDNILILTGGSDVLGLGNWLPEVLDAELKPSSTINWIKGPYAEQPKLPKTTRLKWKIFEDLEGLDELIVNSNYVWTLYGVSFFESIQYGIPTVVVPLSNSKNVRELEIIENEKVALVSSNIKISVNILKDLMENDQLATQLSQRAKYKMQENGCDFFY